MPANKISGFNPTLPSDLKKRRKKHVLITGIAGFIGSHLAERLLNEGYYVSGVDNFSTGSEENIRHLYSNNNFSVHNYDVTKFMSGHGIDGNLDYILHLASPASPVDYLRLPIETLKAGSYGTHNCLGLAKYKIARFILASTSEVYGDPLEHPQKETYWGNVNSIGVRSVYDEAKRFSEALTMQYNRSHNVNTGIVRLFNTYGSRMRVDDGRAVPAFFSQAIKGEELTVFGDGTQTRSLTYIDDTVEGIYRMMLSDYNGVINIGNDQECTLNELANEIIEITQSQSKIIYTPLPQDDPKQRKPDISMAKKILRWNPFVKREEGLEKTYIYFKNKILQSEPAIIS